MVYNDNILEKTTQEEPIEILSDSEEGNAREDAPAQTTTGNAEAETETE